MSFFLRILQSVIICHLFLLHLFSCRIHKMHNWETSNHSAIQDIRSLLCDVKFHYRGHKCPQMVPILSHMHPVHTFPSYFPNIHSNIIFPSTPCSSMWSLPSKFYDQSFVYVSHLSHTCYMPRPSHPPPYDHPNNIWWSVLVMKLLIMQSSPFPYHFFPFRPKYSPQHPVFKHYESMFFS